jgi:uncharacterized membrane protein YbhN (UPF0104 family)/tRNA A-37 threonylcarbamoyl transferase component Bud32
VLEGSAAAVGRRLEVFSAASDEPYRRRAIDAIRLLVAAFLLTLLTVRAGDHTTFERRLASFLASIPGAGADWWRVPLAVGVLYGLALVAICLIARRRSRLVVQLLAAALGAWGAGLALGGLADGAPPGPDQLTLTAGEPTYPALLLAIVTAVIVVAAPHLSHPLRRVGRTTAVLMALATLFLPLGGPIDTFGGLLVGWGIAAIVHLALGAPGGHPTVGRVRAALEELGVDLRRLTLAPAQPWGSTTMVGDDGSPVLVRVYGRDAADAQLLAKAWRFAWYRDSGPTLTLSRLQQVEHEAYLTLLAERAGVSVPDVVAAGRAGAGDAVLAMRVPPGSSPLQELEGSQVTDHVLAGVWEQVERLHEAGIAHGGLNASNVLIGSNGHVTIVDFGASSSSATSDRLGADRAELLVSTTLLVGEERALRAAERAAGGEALSLALAFVQAPALTPILRRRVHDRHYGLDDLRKSAARRSGVEVPELVQLRRVSPRNIVMVAATGVAAFLLISQLGEIDLSDVADEVGDAEWGWIVAALVTSQATNLAQTLSTLGAVARPVPLGPTVRLEFATAFTNLVLPGTVARAAVSIRYFQKLGIPTARAATQGVIDSVGGFAVQILLLVIGLAITSPDLHPANLGDDGGGSGWVVLAIGGGVIVVVVVAMRLLPTVRKRIVPQLREAMGTVRDVLSSPRNASLVVTGNVVAQLLFATTLAWSLRAYGESIPFAAVIVVNTGASLFAGLVPVPGGIGIAEGTLTAGLIAYGVPETTAFTAAITHRMLTYYLPPIWGWVAFRRMVRNEYL